MSKLKPCLFCGSSNVAARCNCACSYICCNGCYSESGGYETEADAIAAWNCRVVTKEQVEEAATVHDDILFKEQGAYDSVEYAKMIVTRVFEAAGFEVKP